MGAKYTSFSQRQCGVLVEAVCSEDRPPGVKSWLVSFPSGSPWTVHFILHYLSVLICKIEMLISVPTTRIVRGLNGWLGSSHRKVWYLEVFTKVVIHVLSWLEEDIFSLIPSGCDSSASSTANFHQVWALALLLEASAGSLHSPSWCNVRLLPWCWGYQHLAQRFPANCLYILIKVCVSFESKVDLLADSISSWNGDPPKPRSETREMSFKQLHSFS